MQSVRRNFSSIQFRSIFIIFLFLFLTGCSSNKIHLASDAKTGEYLGVVMTETRDFESKEILSYEIEQEGKRIKKSPQDIRIYQP
jgi:hypothetical protein